MSTLAELRSRIATELVRTDLTTLIEDAVTDAVADYQSTRFAFNQVRGTFPTVAGTRFYSTLTDIIAIDAMTITYNGIDRALIPWSYANMERTDTASTTQGAPFAWCWYDEQIRLYPTPDAVYTVTVSYHQRLAEPAAASSNAWTTTAESLIKYAAKRKLAMDYLRDDQLAASASASESDQLRRLKAESRKLETGGLRGSM